VYPDYKIFPGPDAAPEHLVILAAPNAAVTPSAALILEQAVH
jgi:hypothetical protein